MIYTSFTNFVKTRDYRLFCIMMDIPYGSGTKYRTPAENRVVNQFLLTVNTGRRAVYLNFNRDLAVIVEPRNSANLKDKYGSYRTDINLRHAISHIDLMDSSFSGPSKTLKQLFNDSHRARSTTSQTRDLVPYSKRSLK